MANEYVCPLHGPYPAELQRCPICNNAPNGRPVAPAPLDDEDNMPTDLHGFRPAGGRQTFDNDEAPTELPDRIRGGGRILDEDSTILPGKEEDDDITVPYYGKKQDLAQAIFWVKDGPRRGKIEKLKNRMSIGRRDADITIDDPKVSRNHSTLALIGDHYVIVDNLSENGTWVNGEKISGETVLKENDLIKFGDTTFVLKILE